MIHGVRSPLLTTSRVETIVEKKPIIIVMLLKKAPRLHPEKSSKRKTRPTIAAKRLPRDRNR